MLIVSYFPGAGGHRYLRWLAGLDFTSPGITYDSTITKFIRCDSYMLTDEIQPEDRMMVTHCMNVPHIRSKYPHCDIVQLDMNLHLALRREWVLCNPALCESRAGLHTAIDSAFSTIVWHSSYYKQYPVCVDADTQVISVLSDNTAFGNTMQAEVGRYSNNIFDLAWAAYQDHGPDAPIIDIFEANF